MNKEPDGPVREPVNGSDREKLCLKCLLAALPGLDAQKRSVGEMIAALPEGRRASEETRAERLEKCRACEYLDLATCALCGCYADYRAAQRDRSCPDLPPRWGTEAAEP